jgi:hypothetical protein
LGPSLGQKTDAHHGGFTAGRQASNRLSARSNVVFVALLGIWWHTDGGGCLRFCRMPLNGEIDGVRILSA